MTDVGAWLIWLAAAYGIGSTPFGLLIGRWRGVDIRRAGSGNVGATNVGRLLGRKWGLICFVLDLGKGLGPTAAFGWMSGDPATAGGAGQWMAVGAAAVVGHVFPFWLRFRGGKGVATALGAAVGVWPVLTCAAAVCAVAWLAVTWMTGYVSLASVLVAALLPVAAAGFGWSFGLAAGPIAAFTAVSAALGVLVIVRHRTNLVRLRDGTESRVAWARRR